MEIYPANASRAYDFENKRRCRAWIKNRPDVLKKLKPNVRKLVEDLEEIQTKHDQLRAIFFKEKAKLETKFEKLYEPLYNKRSDIVNNGIEDDNEADKGAGAEKGVPDFWLNAMKANKVLKEEITVRDEDPLKYLKDIKCSRIGKDEGFKLDFYFDKNPYFTNCDADDNNIVLTKTYFMSDNDEPILEAVEGTEIRWTDRKNVTEIVDGTDVCNCPSFFNFFKSPLDPEDDCDLDKEMAAEKLQDKLDQDYHVGSTIRNKIIPRAMSWFMREAKKKGSCEKKKQPIKEREVES